MSAPNASSFGLGAIVAATRAADRWRAAASKLSRVVAAEREAEAEFARLLLREAEEGVSLGAEVDAAQACIDANRRCRNRLEVLVPALLQSALAHLERLGIPVATKELERVAESAAGTDSMEGRKT